MYKSLVKRNVRFNWNIDNLSSVFSRGVSFRAKLSISSSQLYSKYYHAIKRSFLVTYFLPSVGPYVFCWNHINGLWLLIKINHFWSRGILVAMDNKAPQTSGLLTSSVNFLSDVLFIVCNILSGTISSWCLEKLSRDSISSIRTKSGKRSHRLFK